MFPVKRSFFMSMYILILGLLAFLVLTCSQQEQSLDTVTDISIDDDNSNRTETVEEIVPVETEIVSTQTIYDFVSTVGSVSAFHDVMVSSETSGKVVQVLVEVGDDVSKGDALIIVDDELQKLGVESAKAQFMLAEANYEKAKRDLERSNKLFESEDISKYELEGAQLQEKSAEAQYLSAKTALGIAERQLADTRVKSPISGKVALRDVDIGATIAHGMPVATVVSIDNVKVVFSVSEKEISKVKVGLPAKIFVKAYPESEFRGEVYTVALKADMSTRTYPVEIVLPNRGTEWLLPGMIAWVEIETGTSERVITVPYDAIVENLGQETAYVMVGNSAQDRRVILGPTVGDRVVITSGLDPGEQLIVRGQASLPAGQRIYNSNDD